jgi:hypothetical protein
MKLKTFLTASAFLPLGLCASDVALLKEQIKILSEKIDSLEKSASFEKNSTQTPSYTFPRSHTIEVKKEKNTQENAQSLTSFRAGKTKVTLDGFIKIDAIYDAGQSTGDASNTPGLMLKNQQGTYIRTGHFRMHGRNSRLNFHTHTDLDKHFVKTLIQADFGGTNNILRDDGVSRASATTTNSYNFRLRQAYINVDDRFLIGQASTNYTDREAVPETLEFNGPTGNNNLRQPQLRYTHQFTHPLSLAVALENPSTTYADETGRFRDEAGGKGGSGGDGQSAHPDLTMQLKYKKDIWHVSLRGVYRQLRIKRTQNPSFHAKKSAWGLGLSGKVQASNRLAFSAIVNAGKGMGRYIYDMAGYCAVFDSSKKIMSTISAYSATLGAQWKWNESWRSNIAYGIIRTRIPSFMPKELTLNKKLEQYVVNLLNEPIKNLLVGLEYNHLKRHTIAGLKGIGKRYQFTVKYTF